VLVGISSSTSAHRRERSIILMLLLAFLLALPASASAHGSPSEPQPTLQPRLAGDSATAVASCGAAPGRPFNPDQNVTGQFTAADQGSYVMIPFDVPVGADAIRIRYCNDQPASTEPLNANKHTIDLGVYEPESSTDADTLWGREEFRGWGGSSRPDTTISGEAVSPEATARGTTDTTVGYLPGAIPAGTWAAELGVAAIADEGPTEDGAVEWRVEIDWIDDPEYSDQPWSPAPYDTTPARGDPGWYAGDLHVHARHSNPNDSAMRTVFDYAFCPDPALPNGCQDADPQPGADLDFITLSDYVTTRHWSEIGRYQPDYPGHLIMRSAEVITYRGHVNNHAAGQWADYRTGPIRRAILADVPASAVEKTMNGTEDLRGPVTPGAAGGMFDQIHAGGGFTQINHPTIFPSSVPIFAKLCRGCPWDYSEAETNYAKVDAIEVATGPAGLQNNPVQPGPNPFTPTAIQFYEDAIDSGGRNANHIAAVGSSDSHKAGSNDGDPLTSPIGQATTVVYADELSEEGIQRGVEAGHTYVKLWGNDGPDLRFSAAAPGGDSGIMGDTVAGDAVQFTARVLNLDRARAARPGSYTLFVIHNGTPLSVVPIPPSSDDFTTTFGSVGPGRYRLQVEREVTGAASIENVSTPIWTTGARVPPDEPPPDPEPQGECAHHIRGTSSANRIRGTRRGDRIRALGGADVARGFAGRDCLYGGKGADRLGGGANRDVVDGGSGRDFLRGGIGPDRLLGGSGPDSIFSRARGRDLVLCGPGRDRAVVGLYDRVRGCERVRRGR
jgi:Ca2+-binding RTX toxin-like protein